MSVLSKYISSEVTEIERSRIKLSHYNPRKISDEARKKLKANIRRLGVMGGIVWNERTGNLVGGHQKIKILDELHKYDPDTKENDYLIRIEKVSLSEKEEIEQNIFLNNKNAQGEYDTDLLADLIDDIDYKLAGLDDYDLNLAGIEVESFINDLDDAPEDAPLETIKTAEQKKEHVKNIKEQVREQSIKEMEEGETYVMLSFSTFEQKKYFMSRFDRDPFENILNGDEFAEMIERAY